MSDPNTLRIDELESRLSFLDDTVDQLNRVIARQDHEIRQLQQRLSELVAKLDDMGGSGGEAADSQQHELPPHY